MANQHTIRLRGPWQLEPIERYVRAADGRYETLRVELPTGGRMTMPADWSAVLGGEFLGRVRYHRVFQRPTGLESGERVFLVVEPPRSRGVVSLSRPSTSSGPSERLGEVAWGGAAGRFDVTDLLQDHNRLEIVVEHPVLDGGMRANEDIGTAPPGGLLGEVRLEIEE